MCSDPLRSMPLQYAVVRVREVCLSGWAPCNTLMMHYDDEVQSRSLGEIIDASIMEISIRYPYFVSAAFTMMQSTGRQNGHNQLCEPKCP